MSSADSAPIRLRAAGLDDAERIARLHADSWRRHYRGAYADDYLDGDVATERNALWAGRLAKPDGTATIVAEDGGDDLAGFVHVILDHDHHWGSLIDNLHVRFARKRSGIGRTLLAEAATIVTARAEGRALYLWVLGQNTAAQGFYRAVGGAEADQAIVEPPGGVPERLNGQPVKIRFSWPDATVARP